MLHWIQWIQDFLERDTNLLFGKNFLKTSWKSVADPEFPRGGGANPRGGGAPTYDFAKFSQKLHEIERYGPRESGASKISVCRSATEN